MRALIRLIGTVLVVGVVVVLAIFALQNTQEVHASFAGQVFSGGLWWFVICAAILGFVLALVLAIPSWIAAGWRGRMLRRTSARHERLLGEHRQVVAELDRLRAGAGGAEAAAPTAVQQPAPTVPPDAAHAANDTPAAPLPHQPARRLDEWTPNGPAVPTA